MTRFNYGSRNGVSTILSVARRVCKVYTSFAGGIITYINASSLSAPQKAQIIAWLNEAVEVCALIETTLLVTYE